MTKSVPFRLSIALQHYLAVQHQAVEAEERGILDGGDPESLHRFRVALRRSRALLVEFKVHLSPELDDLRCRLAEVAHITNDCRDADVFLAALAQDRFELPAFLQPGLDELDDFLTRRHRISQQRVSEMLRGENYRLLKAEWRKWLNKPADQWVRPTARGSLSEALKQRTHRRHRKLVRKLGSLSPDTPPEEVHRFRIACKKLRYLLEFAASTHDKQAKSAIGVLKKIQHWLGDQNDAWVQSEWLRRYLEDNEPDQWTAAAIGWLLALQQRRQYQA